MLMRAIVLKDGDPIPRLEERELDMPTAGPGNLLVRVSAAGLNRAGLTSPRRSGHAAHPLGIPGGELSGVVTEVGPGVDGFAIGDRVMALANGSYAQYAVFDHRLAVHVPARVDMLTAAALPVWYMTAHDAIVTEGALTSGETLLVQGATSGVGMAAAQIARHLGCARVIGIGRSAEKLSRLDFYSDTLVATPDWAEQARALTGGKGADLILDLVGGGALGGNLEAAALGGRIVAAGRLGGQGDTLDINKLAMKRLRLIGVSFRTRTVEQKADIARAFARDVLPAIADGTIVPRIDRAFPMHEAHLAQDYLRNESPLGKVVLGIDL